jgi:bifunctional DNase/RNase
MVEVEVYEISIAENTGTPIVFLKGKEGNGKQLLPIWIGKLEAAAIQSQLIEDTAPSRPMTHDLMKSIIESFDAKVASICVHTMKDETFFGRVTIETNGESTEIDSRPSDAIALALRFGATVYVAEDVMRENRVSEDGPE